MVRGKVSRSINVESRTLIFRSRRHIVLCQFHPLAGHELENGKVTVVRVNDRRPFHNERIIDLSYAAAVKLGFHEQNNEVYEALGADSLRCGAAVAGR